jgi:hypothetical protein
MKGPMRFRSPARGSEPEEHKTGHRGSKGHFQGETRNSSFGLKKDCSEAPPGQKGARKGRERARSARALKGETLSPKFPETAFALKGFIFRDGETPGSGICRNRSGRPRHKSCLPRRTGLVGLDAQARAGGWGHGVTGGVPLETTAQQTCGRMPGCICNDTPLI